MKCIAMMERPLRILKVKRVIKFGLFLKYSISKYFSAIDPDYHLLGELDSKLERFDKGRNYDGFVILKKDII
jgi:hypothetical protein